MRSMKIVVILAVVAMGLPAAARSQSVSLLRVEMDNDYFDFWQRGTLRTDDNYTHGTRLDAVIVDVPRWLRGHSEPCSASDSNSPATGSCVAILASVVQQIFTPRYDVPPETDRPYAGVLFLDIGRRGMTSRRSQTLSLKLGTTGPASGGKAVQQFMHDFNKSGRVFHWENEIAPELVANATYDARFLLGESANNAGRFTSFVARMSGTAGTLESGASGGFELKVGHRLAHPWLPLADANRKKSRAFLSFAVDEVWVARSLVLDGNTPETSDLVSRRPLVAQWMAGLGYGLGPFTAEYRATSRSREYDGGPGWHRWGTLGITYLLR